MGCPGTLKLGTTLGVVTGTHGGYGPWVRTVGMGTMRVRCGYGTGTVRGYSTAFSENRYGGYTVPVRRTYTDRTHVPYPYRTRTQKHVPTYRIPIPTSTYLRTVPYLTPLGMYTVPPP